MDQGQPSHRFKTDQLSNKEAAKVNKVISLQKKNADKRGYESDIKSNDKQVKKGNQEHKYWWRIEQQSG